MHSCAQLERNSTLTFFLYAEEMLLLKPSELLLNI